MKSNCKEVKEKIKNHIFEYYTKEELKESANALIYNDKSLYNAGVEMVEGGNFLIYTEDMKSFLDTLHLNNNSNKTFNNIDIENMYKHLIAREIQNIITKGSE